MGGRPGRRKEGDWAWNVVRQGIEEQGSTLVVQGVCGGISCRSCSDGNSVGRQACTGCPFVHSEFQRRASRRARASRGYTIGSMLHSSTWVVRGIPLVCWLQPRRTGRSIVAPEMKQEPQGGRERWV